MDIKYENESLRSRQNNEDTRKSLIFRVFEKAGFDTESSGFQLKIGLALFVTVVVASFFLSREIQETTPEPTVRRVPDAFRENRTPDEIQQLESLPLK